MIPLENLQVPGVGTSPTTQAYGYLLATDRSFRTVETASANIRDVFDFEKDRVIGADPLRLFSESEAHHIRNVLGHRSIQSRREILPQKEINGTVYRVLLHVRHDRAIIELLPDDLSPGLTESAVQEVYDLFTAPLDARDATGFLAASVDHLRAILDYDRITVLKVDEVQNWQGVAEARNTKLTSLLGPLPREKGPAEPSHWQPRVIVDGAAKDISMIGAESIDLSLALLRGKTEDDRIYMQALEIGAAFDIPLIVENGFWGVIACHSVAAVPPGAATLVTADLAGHIIGLRLAHGIEIDKRNARITALAKLQNVAGAANGRLPEPTFAGKSILVLEPNRDRANMIRHTLETCGCRAVRIVDEADKTLAVPPSEPFDAVLVAMKLYDAAEPGTLEVLGAGEVPLAVIVGLGHLADEVANRVRVPVVSVPIDDAEIHTLEEELFGDR